MPVRSPLLAVVLWPLIVSAAANDSADRCQRHFDDAEYQLAFKACLPAAQAGNANAQTLLGEMYDQGRGTGKSPVDAKKWW